MQAAGILTPAEQQALLAGLDRVQREYGGRSCPDHPAEDIHTWLETTLTEWVGDPGRKIHTARSRNDQVATLLKLYVIEAGERLLADLRALIAVICRRARDWSALPMPLMTHTQFAAPGNVGFWSLRFAVAFDRVQRHLGFCLGHWRAFCPLGSGAVAGSSIAIDRHIQARALGFDQPALHALDATSCRDECLEFLALVAQTAIHLQSLAADVILFCQTPLGWVDYPAAFGTGSSMMPNKVNPDAMEILRGECCALAGAHHGALAVLKGLPSGYNRDLQSIKPLVHETADGLHRHCVMTEAFFDELGFRESALRAALTQGAIGATLDMEQQVQGGMPLRQAHHAIAEALADGRTGMADAASHERYQTLGSASPQETLRLADALLAAVSGPRAAQ